jgi:hypothetical protein
LLLSRQASDHHKNVNDKKTPEENLMLIRMYGGVQFPGTPLEATPPHMLRHIAGEPIRSAWFLCTLKSYHPGGIRSHDQ